MLRILRCFAIASLLVGCGSRPTRNVQSDAQLAVVVRRIIPVGTSLAAAEERLTDEGFRCERLESVPLHTPDPVTRQLHCERLGAEGGPSRLRVTLDHSNGTITGVRSTPLDRSTYSSLGRVPQN